MSSAGAGGGRVLSHLGVLAFYAALAVALTYPLVLHLGSAVPSDLGDPLLNTWILWWNARAVPFTADWWNAPAFFPAEGVLAFSEHLLGLAPFTSPVIWLTGNPQLAYNLTLLLTFALSAFAAYLLCLEVTGRRDAALLGGLVFGFAPYRIAQLPHLQVLAAFWMPVGLFALHRYTDGRRARWLVLFGVAWLLQALSNGYYLAFYPVLVVLWIVWFVPWREWKKAAAIGLAAIVATLPVLPVIVGYWQVHETYDFRRGIDEIRSFSADVTSPLRASHHLLLWGWLDVYDRPEGELFPGLWAAVLALAALVLPRDARPGVEPRFRRLRLLLWAAVLAFGAITVSAAVAPWRLSFAGMSISATTPYKPLTISILCAIALALTSRGVRDAFHSRSAFAFYAGAAAAMWLLSLGPTPTLLGEPVMYQAPYAWLLQLPGFDSLRAPARFGMLAFLCLAVSAALGWARAAPKLSPGPRLALAALLAAGVAADSWLREMPLEAAPAPRPIAPPAGSVLVELPFGDGDMLAMYRWMDHGVRLANGYSGHFPSAFFPLRRGLNGHDPGLLPALAGAGVTHVLVDTTEDRDGAWHEYVSTDAELLQRAPDGSCALYRLHPVAPPAAIFGAPLAVAGLAANVNPELLRNMTDGDLFTRWETGPQKGVEELLIDLGSRRMLTAVRMSLGPFVDDYPRELIVELSEDGSAWVEAWRGHGSAPAFLAAVREPRTYPLTIPLGDRAARFVRLRQLGSDDTFYWSIGELSVLGPGTD
jgi:hypothetical protein